MIDTIEQKLIWNSTGGVSDIIIDWHNIQFSIQSCKYTIEDGKAYIQVIFTESRFKNYNFDNLKVDFVLAQNTNKTEYLFIKNPTLNYRYVSGKELGDLNGCYVKWTSKDYKIDKCNNINIEQLCIALQREEKINSILED